MPDDTQASELPGLDLPAVRGWLEREVPGLLSGPLTASLVAGGRSNLTYALDHGSAAAGSRGRWVLRRPPLGHVLATAHDMAREHTVISALAGTAVPVPQAVALCTDPEVTGAPFYVMELVEGLVLRSRDDVAGLDTGQRSQVALAMMDVLADLHAVDPAAVGLAHFGRPEGFMERQVRRWGTQLASSRSRAVEGIEQLHERLAASVPAQQRTSVVHGDYRLDNLVVTPGALSVAAVLDWEMATLGDPLADVGLLLAYWDGLARMDNPIASGIGPATGFPPGRALVERYAERADVDLGDLRWYVGFGFFKIAVILEGIHYRYVSGQTVGAGFDSIGALVPPLVRMGLQTLEQRTPGQQEN